MRTPSFGKLFKKDGTKEELYFRDMTNKIMHSSGIEWNFSNADSPIVVCHSDDPERWMRAEIKISRLAAFCGNIIS